MFMYLQKNKKGFTLIELMVVVAIIGVLALLGLRLYTGQQNKAKEAIVKANAATVHTLIQSDLADGAVTVDNTYITNKLVTAGMQNPFTGSLMVLGDFLTTEPGSGADTNKGRIVIIDDAAGHIKFTIYGLGANGLQIGDKLTAQL